jgi:hypothetical protein
MANLGYSSDRRGGVASEEDIKFFLRQYSAPGYPTEDSGDMEGGADAAEANSPFSMTASFFIERQRNLRLAWEKKDASLYTSPPGSPEKGMGYKNVPLTYGFRDGVLEIRVADCYALMDLLLTRDVAEGRTRICRRPNCPHPYFIAQRRDAKYCSHLCASDVSQKIFRRKQKAKNKKGRRPR